MVHSNIQKPIGIGEKIMLEDSVAKKGLFTVLEAANYLSLSRSMIYNLMESGKLRYVKIGSARRIPWNCCQELIDSNLAGGWNLYSRSENLKY